MMLSVDIRDHAVAAKMLELQRAAYQVESALINYTVPALHDTVENLTTSGERFLVYTTDERYAGAVGYTCQQTLLDISRLVVHPDFHRRGIAARLLSTLEQINDAIASIQVSTAAANTPAVRLYQGSGYQLVARYHTPDGRLELVMFEKRFAHRQSSSTARA